MSTPQFPERGQNIFQDAKRRGLSGVIGGTLDNLTMGMTDFDKRGDSLGQQANKKFLKEFIFGTEGKKMADMGKPTIMGEPTIPVPGMPPLPEDFLDPTGDLAEERNKSVTEKVDRFLDPTGDLAEKKLDSINIEGKDYKIYTDKNTGEEFIPFDPRISGNKGDFDRYGKPLTEEQKKLIQQGARIGSFIPNPYTEEQMREIGRENL